MRPDESPARNQHHGYDLLRFSTHRETKREAKDTPSFLKIGFQREKVTHLPHQDQPLFPILD